MDTAARRAVAWWLLACCMLVCATLVVGGATRLTQSGLSIVEWRPLVGVVPPLDEADWEAAFAAYRATPEYRRVNAGMPLEAFQRIYWWEYAHRMLGRVAGAAFLLPLLWFAARRRIDRALAARLAAVFALGGLQGALGWFMVRSGLVDDPHVSQYRLVAHLSLAVAILGAMLWLALGLMAPRLRAAVGESAARLRRLGLWLFAGACYMVASGGFVAGLRAGKAYNSFPLMDGALVPAGIFARTPWYANFFENAATAQFDHRLGAWVMAFLVPWFWRQAMLAAAPPRVRLVAHLLLAALALQVALGIATLLLAVPVHLGAAHQAGAMTVFALVVWLNHELRI